MKTKLHRTIFQRQMLHGEAMDNSANAIYLNEVRQLSAALARADTAEASARKLALKCLWRTCGLALMILMQIYQRS